jgi:hypothetical protein
MLRWIGWVIVGLILVFICGLVSSAPIILFIENTIIAPFTSQEGGDAQRAMERQFGITFPAGAADYRRASLGNRAFWFQFRIAPTALRGLLRDSPFLTCSFPLMDNYRPVFEFDRLLSAEQRNRMSWWNPAEARSFVGGECTGTDYRLFRFFADSSSANLWTLYMEVVRL